MSKVLFYIHNIRQLPESSIIKQVDYFANDNRLIITFHSGRRYEYKGVMKDLVKEWLKSDSVGSFFSKYIKGQFHYEEIEEEEV